ncbi:uncharacterized protein LOC105914243 [Setaria italica]|uniref:uncharacterized protein LOC105914243 n=1 Tax=Setaria italica TaxID=4555 RepID=UPI000645D795|nr:uncharacterized protein LOC105914243 [Setaria italica]
MIRNVCLGKVLIDGDSGLNILFANTLKEIGLCAMDLNPTQTPFFSIVLGDQADIHFIVADFDTAYHGILGRPALAKFMAVPHYVYIIMKMPTPNRVITILGNVQIAYDCERENLQIATTLDLSVRMEEVLTTSKKVAPEELEISTKKPVMEAIKAKP